MIGFLNSKEFNKEADIEQWTEVGGERGTNRECSNQKKGNGALIIPFAEGRSQSDLSMKELSLPTALGMAEPCSGHPTSLSKQEGGRHSHSHECGLRAGQIQAWLPGLSLDLLELSLLT